MAVTTSSLFLLLFPLFASASIAQFTFTSPQQAIEPGAASGKITVEAQDASGMPLSGSTVCLQVSSDSPSGEFSTSGSSWSASSTHSLALTLSSNQYRRNFYYRNSAQGTFALSLRAALRSSGSTCSDWKGTATWTATQPITVVVGASVPPPPPPPTVTAPITHTNTEMSAPPKKTTSKKKSYIAEAANAQTQTIEAPIASASEPLPQTQSAAVTSLFSDALWWVLAIALIVVGCTFLILSRRHAKNEWNITEDSGDTV